MWQGIRFIHLAEYIVQWNREPLYFQLTLLLLENLEETKTKQTQIHLLNEAVEWMLFFTLGPDPHPTKSNYVEFNIGLKLQNQTIQRGLRSRQQLHGMTWYKILSLILRIFENLFYGCISQQLEIYVKIGPKWKTFLFLPFFYISQRESYILLISSDYLQKFIQCRISLLLENWDGNI